MHSVGLELVEFSSRSGENFHFTPSYPVALSSMSGVKWRVAPTCRRVESRMLHPFFVSLGLKESFVTFAFDKSLKN